MTPPAASLPQTGLTAGQALFRHGSHQAGQTVMTCGAAGPVGSIATELASDAGAQVIGTGRAADRDIALDHGADAFVDLEVGPLDGASDPVDLVFDTIGGDVLAQSLGIVKRTGTSCGSSTEASGSRRPDGHRIQVHAACHGKS